MKTIYLPKDVTYKIFHNLKRYAPVTTIEVKKSFSTYKSIVSDQ